jgi:hypothetical protein
MMENVKVQLEGVDQLMRKIKKLDDRIKKRIIKKVGKKALPPMVDSYKRNIKSADEVFKVYRDGKIYAEIQPGQLKKSIGIKTPKSLQSRNVVGLSVGPRRTRRFADPEKGGWYGGMINFGWLRAGDGKKYRGPNFGFAQRAMSASKTKVKVKFIRTFGVEAEREIKRLKFGQKFGWK